MMVHSVHLCWAAAIRETSPGVAVTVNMLARTLPQTMARTTIWAGCQKLAAPYHRLPASRACPQSKLNQTKHSQGSALAMPFHGTTDLSSTCIAHARATAPCSCRSLRSPTNKRVAVCNPNTSQLRGEPHRVGVYLAGHVNEGGQVCGKHVAQGCCHAGLLQPVAAAATLQDHCQLQWKA